MLGKILSAVTVGNAFADRELLRRYLFSSVNILILSIISAFLLCALLAVSFVAIYFSLTHYGITPLNACLMLGGLILILAALLSAITYDQMQKLRSLAQQRLLGVGTDIPNLSNIAAAFMDGLFNRRK